MTKEQLDEILAGMDERERELTLAVDDAEDSTWGFVSQTAGDRRGAEMPCALGRARRC